MPFQERLGKTSAGIVIPAARAMVPFPPLSWSCSTRMQELSFTKGRRKLTCICHARDQVRDFRKLGKAESCGGSAVRSSAPALRSTFSCSLASLQVMEQAVLSLLPVPEHPQLPAQAGCQMLCLDSSSPPRRGSGMCRAAAAALGLQLWGRSNGCSSLSGQNSPRAKLWGSSGPPHAIPCLESSWAAVVLAPAGPSAACCRDSPCCVFISITIQYSPAALSLLYIYRYYQLILQSPSAGLLILPSDLREAATLYIPAPSLAPPSPDAMFN